MSSQNKQEDVLAGSANETWGTSTNLAANDDKSINVKINATGCEENDKENINSEKLQFTEESKENFRLDKSNEEVHPVKNRKLAKIASKAVSNQIAFGLLNMPTEISFDNIPSRFGKPIEDVLNLNAEERIEFAEQLKNERKSQDKENLVAARLGRLHPSNAMFNQGPVINPPPISPGKMVTFTPGGQRLEVDLNAQRPTYFRSEYDRMMYDDATIINTKRMMHQVQEGSFLPKTLDDDIERRYIAEQKFIKEKMLDCVKNITEGCDNEEKRGVMENVICENSGDSDAEEDKVYDDSGDMDAEEDEVFDDSNCNSNDESDSESDSEYEIMLTLVELKFLEYHRNVSVMVHDKTALCVVQLQELINEELNPFLFTKNPQLVELFRKLMKQTQYPQLKDLASVMYNRIKDLYDVPNEMNFEEFFQMQVCVFKEKVGNCINDPISALLCNQTWFEEESSEEESDDTEMSLNKVPEEKEINEEEELQNMFEGFLNEEGDKSIDNNDFGFNEENKENQEDLLLELKDEGNLDFVFDTNEE